MNRFRKWAYENLMRFNKAKCKLLHSFRGRKVGHEPAGKPGKTTVYWDASKKMWPAGGGR